MRESALIHPFVDGGFLYPGDVTYLTKRYELRPISQGFECDLAPITELDAHRVLSIVLELPKEILKALANDDHIDSLERRIIIKKALEAGRAVSDIVQRVEVKI